MYKRRLEEKIKEAAKYSPVIAILGPRQSGKTTLAKQAFPEYTYFSFENIDTRALALTDLKNFLHAVVGDKNVIFDEFGHIPNLLSYLQGIVDASGRAGQFVLAGSQNYLMNEKITQSLAGRVALFTLFPLDQEELKMAGVLPPSSEEIMIQGCYPRIYWQNAPFAQWYDDYIFSYLERDVRSLKNIGNLLDFKRFMTACAARIGQIISYVDLARDVQISLPTVKSWLSLLEASYAIFLLPSYHKNFNKRITKMPKLYFYETALAARLLGIDHNYLVTQSTLKGQFFENYVMSEFIKSLSHQKQRTCLYFWRDSNNNELDCIIDQHNNITGIEIKSGKTFNTSMLSGLTFAQENLDLQTKNSFVVYGGEMSMEISPQKATLVAWNDLQKVFSNQ